MNKRIQSMVLRSGVARLAAFTLLEVLIAVAAMAVLAVGMAAIFDTTGKTVTAGRRVSNFAAAAALIEQQLRQDIASMTREGFLVIRNQYAQQDPNSPPYIVQLQEGVPGGRARRIDELMFFSKGKFRSVRSLLDPDFTAESDSARIYYGHGRRMRRDPTANSQYMRPTVDFNFQNSPNDTDTFLGNPVPDNPNQYASDWILLRHVTGLRPQRTTTTTITGLPPSIGVAQAQDSDIQIALQPAASSIFRALTAGFPSALPTRIRTLEGRPDFASGLIDFATTELSEIRSIVGTADTWPNTAGNNFYNPANNQGADGTNAGPDGKVRLFADDPEIARRIQAWMDDAFPAFSMGSGTAQTRIRCEFAPTDYVGIAASGLASPELDYRRADQVALTAFNFLPRCTEFIVEWSMGGTFSSDVPPGDPNYSRRGEVIWYGMARNVNGQVVALPYGNYGDPALLPWEAPINVLLERHVSNFRGNWINTAVYSRGDGVEFNGVRFVSLNNSNSGNTPGASNQWTSVTAVRSVPRDNPNLIHNGAYDATMPAQPLSSYFGWNDPSFDPEASSATRNGILDLPTDAAAPTIPWPWPKMIRITLSLADPADPSVEQTFQFVFDVPAGHEGR